MCIGSVSQLLDGGEGTVGTVGTVVGSVSQVLDGGEGTVGCVSVL